MLRALRVLRARPCHSSLRPVPLLSCWLLALAASGARAEDAPAGLPTLGEAQARLAFFLHGAAGDDVAGRATSLIATLGHSDFDVREGATRALIGLGPNVWPLVQSAALHSDIEVAARAALVLRDYEEQSAAQAAQLGRAIDLLAQHQPAQLVPDLIELVGHRFQEVRYQAEYGLLRITGKSFGDCTYGDSETRAHALAAWRRWWAEAQRTFVAGAHRATNPWAGILVGEAEPKKLFLYDLDGKLLWERPAPDKLIHAAGLDNGHVLVLTSGDPMLREYDVKGQEVWCLKREQCPLTRPVSIQPLPNGNLLIATYCGGVTAEIDREGRTVWSTNVKMPYRWAHRADNGNTLLVPCNREVWEMDRARQVVWKFGDGATRATEAVKLPQDTVLIGDPAGHRVIEVDPAGRIVWQVKDIGEPQSVNRLADGRTAIGTPSDGVFLVDREGRKVKTIHQWTGGKPVRSKFTLVSEAMIAHHRPPAP